MVARILVIDNYDSFVFNLVQYLGQIGAETTVWRNDDERLRRDLANSFDGILLSPGPGTPESAGDSVALVQRYAARLPIFGVCLGLQAIAVAFGGRVDRAPELLHGKTSTIAHDGVGIFDGLAPTLSVTRYHSLALVPETLPAELEVSARTESGVIMGLRHRELPIDAVQYHPESVLTEGGYQILANWLRACGDADAPRRASNLRPLLALD